MEDSSKSSRMDRRKFLKVASLLGGGIILVACAPATVVPTPTAAPKSSGGATPAPVATTVPAKPKVSADIKFAATSSAVGFHMFPTLVAMELFFKEEGITQSITPFSGGGDTVRAVVTGGHQIGQPAPNAMAIAYAEGQPIRIIAENLPFGTISWVVKADSPLKSMKDIKGKKVGYSRPGSVTHTYALTALRSLGFKPDEDVNLVASGGAPETLTALRGGVIDVGWANDPLLSQELLKKDIRVLASANDFIPNWSESMLATTVDYAKSNGDVLTAYLRAHQKAMDYIKSNPDKAAEIFAKGQQIDLEVAKAAMKNYPLAKFTAKINPETLKAITEDMLANNQVKTAPEWNKIVDQSFLAPELRSTI